MCYKRNKRIGENMIDETDKIIIQELKKNSRITMKELSQKVYLSSQATTNRIQKLEDHKIISSYTIETNDSLLGYQIHAMITVYINELSHNSYLNFIKHCDINILHHYKIVGDGCYKIEAKFTDHDELDTFLAQLNHHANYRLTLILHDIKDK